MQTEPISNNSNEQKDFLDSMLKAKNLQKFQRLIQRVEGQANLRQNAFQTCIWKFIRSNISEQLEFTLHKNNWDLKTCWKKLENDIPCHLFQPVAHMIQF